MEDTMKIEIQQSIDLPPQFRKTEFIGDQNPAVPHKNTFCILLNKDLSREGRPGLE